ncbi:hypothetical protein Clacol_007870 [Clathrus columnatus]|uniref:Uncharacterized protein n=1 Tax=Clathrus columnatus TaxID=1419009 RepID=A0AAV5ALN2_9AGAM|nr:hypothetical protein Clacol_007870 [Clathrus columnatus]
MTSAFAQKVGVKLFKQHLKDYEPADPLYETYVDNKGRTKRRRRVIPPGLSKRDAKILKKIQSRAHYLDKGFTICGMRFGWTFLIGLVPFAGDVTDALLNYHLVVKKARQAEIPDWLLRRMLINNAIAISLGLVPLIGDIGMASFKTNSRNAALLEEFLRIRGEEYLKVIAERSQDPAVIKPGAGMSSDADEQTRVTETSGLLKQSKNVQSLISGKDSGIMNE